MLRNITILEVNSQLQHVRHCVWRVVLDTVLDTSGEDAGLVPARVLLECGAQSSDVIIKWFILIGANEVGGFGVFGFGECVTVFLLPISAVQLPAELDSGCTLDRACVAKVRWFHLAVVVQTLDNRRWGPTSSVKAQGDDRLGEGVEEKDYNLGICEWHHGQLNIRGRHRLIQVVYDALVDGGGGLLVRV